MKKTDSTLAASDSKKVRYLRFEPEGREPKAIVHVSHGMAEHADRYERFAEAATAAGYVVYANDHRGHGKTAERAEELGFLGPGGFRRVVDDLVELIAMEKREHPGIPVVLLGHSMGSYIAQDFAIEHGGDIAGLILSGTAGKPNLLASAGRLVARGERLRHGPKGKSKLMGNMSFGRFNAQFAPNRTAFDWLSRDEAEVDKYIADPLCGFDCSTSLWVDLLDMLSSIAEPARQAKVPKDLPIYVYAGTRDPVGENNKSIEQLLGAYAKAGVRDVTKKFYPDARHETLNETNRDEVTADVIAWLDEHVVAKG